MDIPPSARRAVSGNYFDVLGVRPALGRTLTPGDDGAALGRPVVVLSYRYWQQRFGGDPRITDTTMTLNGTRFTIIGVAAPGFSGLLFGENTKVWIPLAMADAAFPGHRGILTDTNATWLTVAGILEPGVGIDQANAARRDGCQATRGIRRAQPDSITSVELSAVVGD